MLIKMSPLIPATASAVRRDATRARKGSRRTRPGNKAVVRLLIVTTVACTSAFWASGIAAPYGAQGCDSPSLIAHRGETGDGRNLPENTWQAELDAAAEGATYLDVDVRWTRDGVPVALHDPTVNRTTSEPRAGTPITALSAQQYTALDARAYAGDTAIGAVDQAVHPDTLAQVLASVAPGGKPIVVQMEADPYQPNQSGGASARDFTALARVIMDSGDAHRVIVAGWTIRDLRALHADAPGVTLAFLAETIGAKAMPPTAELAAVDTHVLYIDYRGITAADTSSWHATRLKVWAWTPAASAQWRELRSDGVDAIATNWSRYYLGWFPRPCSASTSD